MVARTREGSAAGEGLSVFIIERRASSISLTPLITIAADKQFEVVFNKVSSSSSDILGDLDTGWSLVEVTLRKAAAIQCAEMVGVAQQVLEMTASYAPTRIQFGRPIGSFQAVQHRLADMLIDVEGARWTTYQAVWRLSKGLPAAREVAIAKAWTSDACQRVASGAQHIHGGLGMEMDYDLHFYFRRAKALAETSGLLPFIEELLNLV